MREKLLFDRVEPTHSPIPESHQLTIGLGSIRQLHDLKPSATSEFRRRPIDGLDDFDYLRSPRFVEVIDCRTKSCGGVGLQFEHCDPALDIGCRERIGDGDRYPGPGLGFKAESTERRALLGYDRWRSCRNEQRDHNREDRHVRERHGQSPILEFGLARFGQTTVVPTGG